MKRKKKKKLNRGFIQLEGLSPLVHFLNLISTLPSNFCFSNTFIKEFGCCDFSAAAHLPSISWDFVYQIDVPIVVGEWKIRRAHNIVLSSPTVRLENWASSPW